MEKVTIEFDSYSSLKKFIKEESGIESIYSELSSLRKELMDIKNERIKAFITTDVVSDTYSKDNIENVVNFIEEKAMNFEMKHEEPISLSNLYSNVLRRIIKEYPTLSKEVCISLWKSAWKYGIQSNVFYMDKKSKKIILNKRMVGNSSV